MKHALELEGSFKDNVRMFLHDRRHSRYRARGLRTMRIGSTTTYSLTGDKQAKRTSVSIRYHTNHLRMPSPNL